MTAQLSRLRVRKIDTIVTTLHLPQDLAVLICHLSHLLPGCVDSRNLFGLGVHRQVLGDLGDGCLLRRCACSEWVRRERESVSNSPLAVSSLPASLPAAADPLVDDSPSQKKIPGAV